VDRGDAKTRTSHVYNRKPRDWTDLFKFIEEQGKTKEERNWPSATVRAKEKTREKTTRKVKSL